MAVMCLGHFFFFSSLPRQSLCFQWKQCVDITVLKQGSPLEYLFDKNAWIYFVALEIGGLSLVDVIVCIV